MNDYYEILGVSRDASAEDIKRAYRRKARQLHPDVAPGREDEFKQVGQAYDVLGDPAKKAAYDRGSDPYADPTAGFGGAGGAFTFSDIMDAFFGGQGGAPGPRSRQQPGQDALVRLDVPLRTAVFGNTEDLTVETAVLCTTCQGDGCAEGSGTRTCDVCQGVGHVQQVQRSFLGQVMTTRPCSACQGVGETIIEPCVDCHGDGRVRERRTLKVKVPAGVDTGTRIQLAGQGEVGPGGGPAGSLYVEIHVEPDSTFVREGDDLHCSVELPMTAAALGTTATVETFDGPEQVEIPAGTQHGEVFTLRAQGVGHLRREGRGDLHVHADVRTPTRLDGRQRELLQELASLRSEDGATGTITSMDDHRGSFFGRLRDAFSGR
ncbi:molecular chaperone DnaJ [Kytococcus aerolatus]|uniref:Chaperone protein DnaJ n=1 Tax=Kytococcus aerolatus TaxID=592308 RepID=A0A212U2C1_9MICO|nr:molecular chaperone DnaJ [Kytococcus aerolatus]SNC72383.1 molecular chaperone DnaJ [Kytococcus aerolatus]